MATVAKVIWFYSIRPGQTLENVGHWIKIRMSSAAEAIATYTSIRILCHVGMRGSFYKTINGWSKI